jgi:hypothetical protein
MPVFAQRFSLRQNGFSSISIPDLFLIPVVSSINQTPYYIPLASLPVKIVALN